MGDGGYVIDGGLGSQSYRWGSQPCCSWMIWQLRSTFSMKMRFMCSQWRLRVVARWQYSSMLKMFFRRCGSVSLAQTMRRSTMASTLKAMCSLGLRQVTVLKARKRSLRLLRELREERSVNSRVTLFQLQLRQLQWNMSRSVFSMFSSMLVMYLMLSTPLPAKYSIRYSLRPTTFSSFDFTGCTSRYPFFPSDSSIFPSISWLNGRIGFSLMNIRTWQRRVSTVIPSADPIMNFSLPGPPPTPCPPPCCLMLLSLREASENMMLSRSSSFTLSSRISSTRAAASALSRRVRPMMLLSMPSSSAQMLLLLGWKRRAANSELLRHFTSELHSRKSSLSSRHMIKALGVSERTWGSRKLSTITPSPSICRNRAIPSGMLRMRSRWGLRMPLILRMNSLRQAPQTLSERVSSTSRNSLRNASWSISLRRGCSIYNRQTQQGSWMGTMPISFLRGGMAQTSWLMQRLIFLSEQVQSRQDTCTTRFRNERSSMGPWNLRGFFLVLRSNRSTCDSTSVFSYMRRYSAAASLSFSSLVVGSVVLSSIPTIALLNRDTSFSGHQPFLFKKTSILSSAGPISCVTSELIV